MVSYTPALGLTLQVAGTDSNTWGGVANALFQMLENSIAGYDAITLGSTNVDLSAPTPGSASPAYNAILAFNGTLSANIIVTIPNVNKTYLVNNATSGAYTVKLQTATPTTALVLPQGGVTLCYCDGNLNVISAAGNASTLGGSAASTYARLDPNVSSTGGGVAPSNVNFNQNSYPFYQIPYTSTPSLDAFNGNSQLIVLTGDAAFTTTGVRDGQPMTLIVAQDSGGAHACSFSSSFVFPNGNNAIDQSANGFTVIEMVFLNSLDAWICNIPVTGYTTGSAVPFAITISNNTHNFNLLAAMGGTVSGTPNITITVAPGVLVSSMTPLLPAMDLSGMPSGSVVNLINLGYIQGGGGYGGDGGWQIMTGSGGNQTGILSQAGGDGGPAIFGPGSSTTLYITNSGYIWGGGGGGGGGGLGAANSGAATLVANGGGGGCGAGGNQRFGKGATAINPDTGSYPATDGGCSIIGIAGTDANGAGGAGNASGSGMAGGAGGDGGNWGAAGTAGGDGGGGTYTDAGGAAGDAGNAVLINSSAVTFKTGGLTPHVKGAIG
jgi:hypothetical protein